MRTASRSNPGLLAALLLATVTIPGAFAQDETGEDAAWREDRKKLENVIDARVQSEVKKLVSQREVATNLRLDWPVNPPTQTKKEIEAAVDEKIAEVVEEKYPRSEIREFQKEADEKYRLFEEGEKVSFVIRGGRGPNTFVSGRLRDVTDLRIHVDNRWIVRTDMEEEDLARFDPDISERYRKKHVRVQTMRYNLKREDYAKDLKGKLLPAALREAGYVLVKGKYWISKKDVLERVCELRMAAHEKRLRPQIEQEVFTANGYVFNENTQEWMPKKVSDSITAKLKRLLQRQQEEQAAIDPFAEEIPPEGGEVPPEGLFPPAPEGVPPEGAPPPPPEGGLFDEDQ